jgi:hypothetical protein
MMTRSEWNQLHAILNGKYFIFKNDGGQFGERIECRWHRPDPLHTSVYAGQFYKPVYHTYFSYMCETRPFRGLVDGLWCIARHVTDRYANQLRQVINWIPEIATTHPQFARDLESMDPEGETAYGVLLSVPQPITEAEALRMIERINDKRPPVRLTLSTL